MSRVRGYFASFSGLKPVPSALRAAITAACRLPEADCVPALALAARHDPATSEAVSSTARNLITALRKKARRSAVEALVQEYALSSQEGVALMCLAEALLRIPDTETRDALIRDKIADGDWASHLGGGKSLFVNAATWGLVVTGKLTTPVAEASLGGSLTRLIARLGEPVIRRGVDLAMRMMGEQFVMGETIGGALDRATEMEAQGFRYSYDMLGEAAMTAEDAERYFAAYEMAIHSIGAAASRRGVVDGPGISIKLSALHPRYSRAQSQRVLAELLPRVKHLATLARGYDIGLNIDAEEADRLELSLDLLESLSLDPDLAGWDGLGFVVQAYGKRCSAVLDFIIDLARRSGRRLMVRLVKGAYWDAEIKRAQLEGLADYPVFTRKAYTDVSYLAAARKLLGARDAVFPQFATHNAQTLAAIYHLAGPDFRSGDYEFQCLHGMGEALYEEVVGPDRLQRPCRIYAPVGTHETLLAYLVRRLLENGANSSFVHKIADAGIAVDELVADPVEQVLAMPVVGAPHPAIALPGTLFADRHNSAGLDLSSETTLSALEEDLIRSAAMMRLAAPPFGTGDAAREIRNPGDQRDVVGSVIDADAAAVARAVAAAKRGSERWSCTPVADRAACLRRAADALQHRMPEFLGLLMREAGKTVPNAIAEVREAIDFLRFYAVESALLPSDARALGPVVCISPWNFPLAIFLGQVAAALVAGNSVLAKPAEETPLVAAEGVRLLHEAGIPDEVLQLLPGDGCVGAALVAADTVQAVMFTGSTEVARRIQKTLAQRTSADGKPVPLVAETGGLNAMIVDSSALPEQVVADVIASAFDSAGQRCSALRILCVQEDIADRLLEMLRGALAELNIGPTDRLSVDVGPVISTEAKAGIETHVDAMRRLGHRVWRLPLGEAAGHGTFVAPTIIEVASLADVQREIFGPVLHVMRYPRAQLDKVIEAVNAPGYGLTFGLHTRIDETIAQVMRTVSAGNRYINRNMIGAVVGVQPFGGQGLSGTGPKAGGPLYLTRLIRDAGSTGRIAGNADHSVAQAFAAWLGRYGTPEDAAFAQEAIRQSPLGYHVLLPGPVGEENRYALRPRGRIYLAPQTARGFHRQLALVLATGNEAVVVTSSPLEAVLAGLPPEVLSRVTWVREGQAPGPVAGVLIEGEGARVVALTSWLASLPGPLVPMQSAATSSLLANANPYNAALLVEEISTSINTTAAGGNASLMTLT